MTISIPGNRPRFVHPPIFRASVTGNVVLDAQGHGVSSDKKANDTGSTQQQAGSASALAAQQQE